ncbi:hypothetical protein J5N97_014672 [Dioscorea zingiberensis]|uniref:WRKY domain-containing protein n=1 Tax=Dioscorea zingiberensis TaxID=325984 RepID=A0A9D5CTW4_9LILI|nr:hypothetical protein J5N97_014672 [Dioscorea zingiberensis]
MDDILAHVLHGCKLAGDIEAGLAALASQPQHLLSSCEEVVDAFTKAINCLSSQTSQHLVFGPRLDLTMGEGSSSHEFMQAMDFMHAGGLGHENEIGGLGGGAQSLGMVVTTTTSRSTGMIEFGGSGYPSSQPAALALGGGGISGEPSGQRPSRKRKDSEGARTVRVPAPRTGNTESPPDDGYTWRKYGQKDILGSKFPRSYFRCTHKNFYGCEAKKQVQRLNEDPFTYEVTYCGDHSCQTSTSPLIIPSISPPHSDSPVAGTTLTPATSLSTSINLGSWFSREVESSDHRIPAVPSSEPPAGDYPLADFADVMFNYSGSSGSSMDAIFPSKQDDPWKGKDQV